eukprot:SAG11_NODE_3713_length_2265_cov_69.650508_2_plen_223_part_00
MAVKARVTFDVELSEEFWVESDTRADEIRDFISQRFAIHDDMFYDIEIISPEPAEDEPAAEVELRPLSGKCTAAVIHSRELDLDLLSVCAGGGGGGGEGGLSGRIFMLYGSGIGQREYLQVEGGRIQNPEPCVLYLDSGPFEERAVNMLRDAGYQVFTYDGSSHAGNYRHKNKPFHRRENLGQVSDVAILPAEYLTENDEANDDVQRVYRIHFEQVGEGGEQ